MAVFFAVDRVETFQPYTTSHMAVIILVILANFLVFRYRNHLRQAKRLEKVVRLSIALLLVILEIGLMVWEAVGGIWSAQGSLPLQLCDLSLILSVIVLCCKNRKVYEIAYFLGVGGAGQALLTPDTAYAFPHFVFVDFFLAHSLIITALLWMTFVHNFRPHLISIGKSMFWTNVYAMVIGLFNFFSGSNYAYLCAKPGNPSLLDYLGDWPWYILSLEIVALLVYLVCYLPFITQRSARKEKGVQM